MEKEQGVWKSVQLLASEIDKNKLLGLGENMWNLTFACETSHEMIILRIQKLDEEGDIAIAIYSWWKFNQIEHWKDDGNR